ncbi:ATP-binding protein [Candidatus Woesearchaeota archaeon]|nr:ATP-binding protein [Candidatus Woesearchaeota archaeon]
MILGRIVDKFTTTHFKFLVDGSAHKFDFCQVYHKDYGYVLCQIIELERDAQKTIARCNIVGFKDDQDRLKPVRIPFEPGSEVLTAEDEYINSMISPADVSSSALIGFLEGRSVAVSLNLRTLLTKHLAVLAKSGAGKSYTVGVLLEEIIEKRVPLIVIDPHGEYSELRNPTDNVAEKELLAKYKLKPKGFSDSIKEFTTNNLRLSNKLTPQELLHLLPSKMSPKQEGLIYSVLHDVKMTSLEELIMALQSIDDNTKWSIVSVVDYLRKTGLFSQAPTTVSELVKPGQCTIINLKGVEPELQEIIVHKLLSDLFNARKNNQIPPFFAVVEEAHNYCPERGFGEAKSSKIIRTVASEGRKFGMGLCIVSQRPARVDKSVLSQCTSQIILKITNPNDLKAITSSVEGVTSDTEGELTSLPIGTAMVTGVTEMPLFVNIRPRKTMHGGRAADILAQDEPKDLLKETQDFEAEDILAVIKPKMTAKDIVLMSEEPVIVETYLIPCLLIKCKTDREFNILVDMIKGSVIKNLSGNNNKLLDSVDSLEPMEFYQSIVYAQVDYKKKLEAHLTKEQVLKKFEKKCTVLHSTDCFVVYYSVKSKV